VGSDPLIGMVLAERYRIVAPVGRGGAGTVYRGVQLQLDRDVAIKVVRPDVSEETRAELQARFYREASLAGRLSHPAIVQTIDYGTTDQGQQFVVMELLVGRTLRDAVKAGPLPAAEVARIGAELARGLHHAHSRGMIHRDVKASNVLLVRDEEGVEHPKLLDFGLVKSVVRELEVTQTPTYLGTPLYMSPEQARGATDLDGRTDQYSLGCLLYSMCCGVLPFVGETPMATALLHMSEPYPPMRERAPDVMVDPDLEAIVRRAMHRDPADRYEDAAALARALEDWAQRPAPVASEPPAAGARYALLGAAATLGVVGLAGVVVLVLGLVGVALYLASSAPQGADGVTSPADVASSPVGDTGLSRDAAPAVNDDEAVTDAAPAELAEPANDPPEPPRAAAPVASPRVAPEPSLPASRPDPSVPSDAGGVIAAPAEPRPARSEPASSEPALSEPASSEPASSEPDELPAPVTVDGVTFTRRSDMTAVLRFANGATRSELVAAGIVERYGLVDTVIDNRPYRSVQQLGGTKGIGPDTMKKLHAAALAR